MTDEGPLDEVCTVVDGSSGEVFKGGGDEEEVGVDTDDGGIRVEAGDDGIVVHSATEYDGLSWMGLSLYIGWIEVIGGNSTRQYITTTLLYPPSTRT